VLESPDIILDDIGYEFDYLVVGDSKETPKLHMKANYMIAGDAWRKLMVLPEWGPVMREYILYLASLVGPVQERPDPRGGAPGRTRLLYRRVGQHGLPQHGNGR
jgi:hypothetical protein